MPSLVMERGSQKMLDIMEDGLGRDLLNAGRFCFSCEQIFASRKCLEEHVCSAASFICSCGTEFTEYSDMLEHSTKHEPGHQVLDHETIRKRRMEKRMEEEKQLKRLQTGEVVWKKPKLNNVPTITLPGKPVSQVPIRSAMPQLPMQLAQISQVPGLYPSVSQASSLPNPNLSTTDMKNIFAGVGAPTVDLWPLYQPVVLLQTARTFNKKKPYSCNKCGQCFMSKTSLMSHHSSHVIDKISGCIGCGLLLSSKKVVPRFHVCNSPNTATKFKLITARPLGNRGLNEAFTGRSQSLNALQPRATPSLQLKSLNLSAARKRSSMLQLKNQNIKTCNQSKPGFHLTPSLQLQSQNPRASKPYITVCPPLMGQSLNPSASIKSSQGFLVSLSGQLKTPTNSALGAPSKPTPTSSASNGFNCRVCHLPFETSQLLQRHKCVKAQEFMAQHVRGGRQHYKFKRAAPVANPNPAQMNAERKFGIPTSGKIKTDQGMAVGLDKGKGAAPVNGKAGVEMEDDDCYIVESGPDKPAEVIYQVVSSVPIKT
ncbi:uncharacterized protein [Pempheris klunzingeri]|uniref:uncharacterized protein n=1 Tax=Pempheris klunzingeri TaxID=3127111 RepID=UPI00398142E2